METQFKIEKKIKRQPHRNNAAPMLAFKISIEQCTLLFAFALFSHAVAIILYHFSLANKLNVTNYQELLLLLLLLLQLLTLLLYLQSRFQIAKKLLHHTKNLLALLQLNLTDREFHSQLIMRPRSGSLFTIYGFALSSAGPPFLLNPK